MTTNEAAERLRDSIFTGDPWKVQKRLLDAALAAERRATVERIRERLRIPKDGFGQLLREVLDEEAGRE